jgi:hypothetical protein
MAEARCVPILININIQSHREGGACTKSLKPETTGTRPPEQPERPEQESEMTGTTGTKMEHDRNKVVEHDRNDCYLGLIQTAHLN